MQLLTVMAFAPEVHDSRTAQAQDASSWMVYWAVLMSLHCTCQQLQSCVKSRHVLWLSRCCLHIASLCTWAWPGRACAEHQRRTFSFQAYLFHSEGMDDEVAY